MNKSYAQGEASCLQRQAQICYVEHFTIFQLHVLASQPTVSCFWFALILLSLLFQLQQAAVSNKRIR